MFIVGANRAAPVSSSAGGRVCAVVVTYRPGPEVPAHIEAVRRQVGAVVVVDNEATAASRERLAASAHTPGVQIIENIDNEGIATALNQAAAIALARGFEWLATFDQDSAAPDGYIAALLAAHAMCPDREHTAILSPLYRDRHLGFVYSPATGPVRDRSTGTVPVPVTAASGNLVATAAIRAVGGFRDDFFMACADLEFCLRCRRAGWQVLQVRSVVLDHALGRYEQRRWLWLNPRINDYDASRRYYQARNLLVLYATYGRFDLRWVIRDAGHYGSDLLKLVLFCERRREKLRAVAMGFWHAMTGRRGRWPQGSAATTTAKRAPTAGA